MAERLCIIQSISMDVWERFLVRLAALMATVLLTSPLIAGEVAPPSNVVGGLRRQLLLGGMPYDEVDRRVRRHVNAFHPGHATYLRIEGMDHGLMLTGTQKASLEGRPDAPFAQQVVDEVLRFFAKLRP